MLMVFGVFFSTGIEFLGVAALFLRFGSIRGWTLAQIAVFYGKSICLTDDRRTPMAADVSPLDIQLYK